MPSYPRITFHSGFTRTEHFSTTMHTPPNQPMTGLRNVSILVFRAVTPVWPRTSVINTFITLYRHSNAVAAQLKDNVFFQVVVGSKLLKADIVKHYIGFDNR